MEIDQLKVMAKKLRIRSLEMAYAAGNNGAHLGGGLSTIELFTILYGKYLKYNIQNPLDENRDRLIVSKGHCVLAYYSALEYVGFLSKENTDAFETNASVLHGHASRNLEKGIDFSGGSLSMGMSFGVGVALACKKKARNNHVYVIVGDGECDEGLIWEAAMSASHYHLSNFTVIVDANKLQYDGETQKIMNTDFLKSKFASFGFDTIEVDGHDLDALDKVFNTSHERPLAIIAHTIKGKGVSYMENVKEWHHSKLNQAQYQQALAEQD